MNHEEARQFVANAIYNGVQEDMVVKHIEVTHDNVGPLGGISSSVKFWLEDDEGDAYHAIMISVYCDDKTRQKMIDELLTKLRRARQRAQEAALINGEVVDLED